MTIEEFNTASNKDKLVELTARVVAVYVTNNAVRAADLPTLLNDVHAALAKVDGGIEETAVPAPRPKPAVNPKKSITSDYIICLEDGEKFKSMKRHLMNKFGLTPKQYRERWDLDPSYPMVAPNYAASRSQLAVKIGLGRKAGRAG